MPSRAEKASNRAGIASQSDDSRLIPEPARSAWPAVAVILAAAILFILIPISVVLPTGADLTALTIRGRPATGYFILSACLALLCAAIVARDRAAIALTLLVFLFSLCAAAARFIGILIPATPFNVVYLVLPVLYGVIVLSTPYLRVSVDWLRPGHLSRSLLAILAILAAVSLVGLIAYYVIVRPDFGHQPILGSYRGGIVSLLLIGVAIAVVNAAVEESIYRGILLHSLDAALGVGLPPLILQAIAFGAFHFNSTEPGISGVALTTLFGLILGWLRRAGRGMLPPYMVHVAVDIGVWTLGVIQVSR